MDFEPEDDDGEDGEEDKGVDEDGLAGGAEAPEVDPPIRPPQLEQQPRREHHEQHHPYHHRGPVHHLQCTLLLRQGSPAGHCVLPAASAADGGRCVCVDEKDEREGTWKGKGREELMANETCTAALMLKEEEKIRMPSDEGISLWCAFLIWT